MKPARRGLAALVVAVCLGVALAGCDESGSMAVDNRSAAEVLVRLTGSGTFDGETRGFSYVVVAPAATRVTVAEMPFAGNRPSAIEFLRADCSVIAEFLSLHLGMLFVVENGPAVEQRKEFPKFAESTVERRDVCPGRFEPPPPDA